MLSPLGSAEGILVTAAIRDIRDRKAAALVLAAMESRYEAERELHCSEERFRQLFDSNIIGITIADLSGRTLEANDAFLTLLGYTRDELLVLATDWNALTPPEFQERTKGAVERLLASGVAAPCESEYVRKDGSCIFVGRPTGAWGTILGSFSSPAHRRPTSAPDHGPIGPPRRRPSMEEPHLRRFISIASPSWQ